MSTTLTIRAGDKLRAALEERANAEGKTISELVREILEEALNGRSLESRAGHLEGKLRLGKPKAPWLMRLRERNWRS